MSHSDLIFITGRQRSGTTVMRLLLGEHGALNVDEIFHSDLTIPYRFFAYLKRRIEADPKLIWPPNQPAVFADYLAELRAEAAGRPIALDVKYFAFSFLNATPGYSAGRAPFIVRQMRDLGGHVIHIVRRNKLRIAISGLIASKVGVWGLGRDGTLPEGRTGLMLDLAWLTKELDRLEREAERAEHALKPLPHRHNLTYETMFNTDGTFAEPTLAAARSALGVAEVSAVPQHRKINPEPLPELIANFDAVADMLAGTHREWMLAD